MLASIGLYSYAFISTRWSRIDENFIHHYSTEKGQQRLQKHINSNSNIQLELQRIRHAFRSQYGLFGYCLDYKWINLLTIKPQTTYSNRVTLFCDRCNDQSRMCHETQCCVSFKIYKNYLKDIPSLWFR